MWWLLSLQYLFLSNSDLAIFIGVPSIDIMMKQFLLLGVIPGTDIFITFNWLIIGGWIVFFGWLATKALPEAIHIVHEQRKFVHKLREIDRISL